MRCASSLFRVLTSCRLTVPESWARYTQENIARSQKERAASERLRGIIDSTMRNCANEMWNNFNAVNNAFNMRIRETTDTRNKLQAHLQKVCFKHRFRTLDIRIKIERVNERMVPSNFWNIYIYILKYTVYANFDSFTLFINF